jgi:hypothetical protein
MIALQSPKPEFQYFTKLEPAVYDETKKTVTSVSIHFIAIGSSGAVEFIVSTGWLLPGPFVTQPAKPFDLAFHSPVPMYDGHPVSPFPCSYLDGLPCYMGTWDRRTKQLEVAWDELLKGGSDSVFDYLRSFYEQTFSKKEKRG